MSTFKYILRHGWFWPLEFLLRPFAVQKRIEANERKELWCALAGTAVTATTIIFLFSFWNVPDRYAPENGEIWIVSISTFFTAIFLFSVVNRTTKKIFDGINPSVFVNIVSAGFFLTGAVIFILTGIGFGTIIGAGIGTITSIFYTSNRLIGVDYKVYLLFSSLYFSPLAIIGNSIGQELGYDSIITIFIIGIFILLLYTPMLYLKSNNIKNIFILFFILFFFFMFSFFSYLNCLTGNESHLLASTISIVILFSIRTQQKINFLNKKRHNAIQYTEKEQKLSIITIAISTLTFLLISFVATGKTQYNLYLIFLYLCFFSFFENGLLLYPLLRPLAWLLYRPIRVQFHSNPFATPLIGKWQSLALPLPGLQEYLAALVDSDIELGYATLKSVQTESYQGLAARNAAKMALNSNKSLVFAGHLAISTNKLTLAQLLVGPTVARSVAILSIATQQNLTEENILLSIYHPSRKEELDIKKSSPHPQLDNNTSLDDWAAMDKLSQEPLAVRLKAACSWLEEDTQYEDREQYISLLRLLQEAAEGNMHHLVQYKIITFSSTSWLKGGWEIVKHLQINCKGMFDDYLSLTFKEARKEYLRKQGEKLSAIDWLDLPWFWAEIGQELAKIWQKIYRQKDNSITDSLHFDIALETKTIGVGNTNLTFQVCNRSGIIAQLVRIHLEKTKGIFWESNDISLAGLFQGHDSTQLNIDLVVDHSGRYVVNGILRAFDLNERSYNWPINFLLHAEEKGTPYKLAEKTYYIVGPRLSNDLLFVGRKQLLRDISLLWQEPANKEALLLIGLRRMGKSSLLEKIHRDGINEKIIPLLIDLQGKASQPAFLQTVAEAMATELQCEPPALAQTQSNPGPTFEQFLRSLLPQLAGRYFLLMIDEANFFACRDYAALPDLLRSLMQAPDVPLLLLFCGTYELRQGARDYDS
ncbi:MAG: hypothetical protein D3924_11210, partial [Candidatus Electrothrix sp. AR4]|nr:hypothetical protein [Candidatus Electrothrix sp. AR4]